MFTSDELGRAAQLSQSAVWCPKNPWICWSDSPRLVENQELILIRDIFGDEVRINLETGEVEREESAETFASARTRDD